EGFSRGRAVPHASLARATPRRWPRRRAATALPHRKAAGAGARARCRRGGSAIGRRLLLQGGAALCARGRLGRRRAAGTFRLAETETSPATGGRCAALLPLHSPASLGALGRTRWKRGGCRASFHAREKCRQDEN